METLGTRLKAAREAKGLSVAELAKITRIKMQQIDGLERDDFSSIPAPAYGKGFVKLIAQVLETDGTALSAQYQAQVDAQPKAPKARETPRPSPPKPRPRPGTAAFAPPALEPAETPVVPAAAKGTARVESKASVRPVRDARVETLPLPPAPDVPEPVAKERLMPRSGISSPRTSRPSALSKEDLLRRWPLLAAAGLLLVGVLFLPWACRRGRQPDPMNFPDLGGAELPLLAVPDTPLFDLPENNP